MTAEVVAALVLSGLWALAAAASSSRPRLRLGSSFGWTCWALAAVAGVGAVGAIVLDASWPATWLVGGVSAALVLTRIRDARRVASAATAEGVAALVVVALGLASAASITISAVATRLAVEWPERTGLVALVALAVVAALTTLVHIAAPRFRRASIWLVGGVGASMALSGLAVVFVHLLVGEIDDGEIPASHAVFAAFAACLLALALVPPLLLWLERRINTGRPDHKTLLVGIDDVLQRRHPMNETLLQTCEQLRRGLLLSRVEAWSAGAEALNLIAADPHRSGQRITLGDNARRVAGSVAHAASGEWVNTWLPGLVDDAMGRAATSVVRFGGDLQGLIVAYGTDIDENVTAVLDEVAHRLGPAMYSASLDASLSESIVTLRAREQALKASHERLVAAADDERARIERDLHDGAQQHLVALSVNLQLARGLLRSDPDRADELLEELSIVARSAVEELRLLSHGIFPKTLEDEGIGPALDETAARHSGVDVHVSSSNMRRFTREIEAAVYFACNEAITNAVKHAGAASVVVNLVGSEEHLVFEVIDDGTGFDVDADGASHGLANMTDRIGAVDGDLQFSSDDNGTRVLGSVPL